MEHHLLAFELSARAARQLIVIAAVAVGILLLLSGRRARGYGQVLTPSFNIGMLSMLVSIGCGFWHLDAQIRGLAIEACWGAVGTAAMQYSEILQRVFVLVGLAATAWYGLVPIFRLWRLGAYRRTRS